MMMLLLRKSAKSLQCVVNEFFMVLGVESVTGSAFSQARQHIGHSAFIELNEKEKWTPKIGQHDKCTLGSSRQPGSGLVVHAVRRAPVKRLVASLGVVEGEVAAQ